MDELTPKQRDVLQMMAQGLTNAQVAERMGISLSGAKWHVSEVLSRLGVDSREEAVILWKHERGLGRRIGRMAGAVSMPKVAWGGAAVAGVGGIAVTVGVVLGGGDGGGSDAPVVGAVEGTPTAEVDEAIAASSPELEEPDGETWDSGSSVGAVVPGRCDAPGQPVDRAPLCSEMEADEVRYAVAIEGARLTIHGLAGPALDQIELTFADGLRVPRRIELPLDYQDGGGAFVVRGTYVSAPTELVFLSGREAVLRHDLRSMVAVDDWPEPASAASYGLVDLKPTEVDRDCVRWDTDHFTGESCVDPRNDGGGGGAGLAGEWPVHWIERGELERVIIGFDDGALVDAEIWYYEETGLSAFAVIGAAERAMTTTRQEGGQHRIVETYAHTPTWYQLGEEPRRPELHQLTFDDGTIYVGLDQQGCLRAGWDERGGSGPCGLGEAFRSSDTRLVFSFGRQAHPGNRITVEGVFRPDVAAVDLVDADGGVHRELTQEVPSPAGAFAFVFFDRMLEARPVEAFFRDADGEVIGRHTATTRGALPQDYAPEGGPPGTQHSFFGPSQNSRGFRVDDPAYADVAFLVRYSGESQFSLALECDTGTATVLEGASPTGDEPIEIDVDYPEGSEICTWRIDPGASWSISAGGEPWRDAMEDYIED